MGTGLGTGVHYLVLGFPYEFVFPNGIHLLICHRSTLVETPFRRT